MDKLLIVANLKSYKTLEEIKMWIESFSTHKEELQSLSGKEIIICPPFAYFFSFSSVLSDNIKLGAQNVSPFDEGAYTGEVNAKQIKDFGQFVLIGHSERRNNFAEGEDMLNKKVIQAIKYGLEPIFLIQGKDNPIPLGVHIVAYEPTFAIGSGNPDTPENAEKISKAIKTKGTYRVLYGGSVTSQNVKNFTNMQNISGVLVGGASLDPEEFIQIIKNA